MNPSYVANLAGAFSLAITDAQTETMRAESGLGPAACAVVITLGLYPKDSIGTLAEVAGVDHSVMVRTVRGLENAGYLSREKGPDRRQVRLTLTRKGAQLRARLLRERERVLGEVLAEFAPDEQERFARLLEVALRKLTTSRKVADFLCRLCDEGACGEDCPVECEARKREVQRG